MRSFTNVTRLTISKALTLVLAALTVVAIAHIAVEHGRRPECSPQLPRLWLDRYNLFGGHRGMCGFEQRGYFYIVEQDGRWWLVDPLGCAFISKGVNHISPHGDYAPSLGYSPYERAIKAKYGNFDAWLEVTVIRLRSWGFNTVGSWSYEGLFSQMPYTVFLGVMASYGFDWVTGRVPDIFDPSFESHADRLAAEKCSPRARDPLLLGYFLDNELRWGPDWRSPRHLLDDFMMLPPASPGKRAAVEALLEAFGGNLERLSRELGLDASVEALLNYTGQLPSGGAFDEARRIFLRRFAERYFSVAVRAVRRHDPNHLVLGVRFAGLPPREVLEVAGKYVDIVSINRYTWSPHEPPINELRYVHDVTGRPVMVTEFSYKAMDSGLPNTKGAGEPVPTQRERAYLAAQYVLKIVELPYVVGYHWFQYMDQPKEGRFDGENSNFGLVRIDDEPWDLLTRVFTLVNNAAEEVHAGILSSDELLKRVAEVVREG
ncbi:MAG: beta-agarase [Thermoprotei archaeon]|nr:MAG: beta-agarase [Thermoprotei archaeon]